MKNISFDDGLKSFTINGDEGRVIRFNPGDANLLIRAEEAERRMREWHGRIEEELRAGAPDGAEGAREALQGFESMLREQLNHIFNADVYDTAFAGQSPLSVVGDGRFLFEAFMDSVQPILKEGVEACAAASRERIGKYTEGYTG